MRNSTTPLPAGSPRWKMSSPKSLSNVRRILCWSAQRAATFSSETPGLLQRSRRRPNPPFAAPPEPAAESSRRPWFSCGLEGINLLFAQKLARVGETAPDILFGEVRIAGQNLRVAPAGGEQFHHQFDRYARAADDRLSSQDYIVNRRAYKCKSEEPTREHTPASPRNKKARFRITEGRLAKLENRSG